MHVWVYGCGVVLSAFVYVQEMTEHFQRDLSHHSGFATYKSLIHSLGGYFRTSFIPWKPVSDSELGRRLLLGTQ